MQTWLSRVFLNAILRLFELYPLVRGSGASAHRELRTVRSMGRKVKLRMFRPAGPCRGIVLDVHGGGWTIGNARINDRENARRATRLGVAVVSVDYRLALAAPVSSLVDDCEAAATWVVENAEHEFGAKSVVIKGASAGAHLAALTLLRLREAHNTLGAFRGAVLFFGLYDFAGTASVRAAGPDNLILHGPTVRATLCKLTPGMTDEERRAPSLSPIFADLTELPPAVFIVGDKDMLLEDNERMEARWRAANDNSILLVVPECPHAFDRFRTAIATKVEAFVDDWIVAQVS